MQNLKQLGSWGPNSSSEINNKKLLSDREIACQIAILLNNNNRLSKYHDVSSIINNPVHYFVELLEQTVIGCVGLKKENKMDKIIHLSVANSMRTFGIGNKLLNTVILNSSKDILYMKIRDDNVASISLANKLGFKIIAYTPKYNYNIFTLCLFRGNNVRYRSY